MSINLNREKIDELRTQFGDAFYLLDSEQFRKNYNELKESFSKIYPRFNIAYSYKTNYTPKLCKIVNELGGYAEVVSEMELELAKRIGVNPTNIIWNGPIKNPRILESFLIEGGVANLDSIEEIKIIQRIIDHHPTTKLRLGIRCNYDVHDGVISRFGFDVDSREFGEVLEFVTSNPNIKFINLQCHFAKRQLEYWPARAKGMVDLIDRLGIVPERVDLGGALFGKMADSLKSQFSSEIPEYDDYAKIAATTFAQRFGTDGPELIIEPGSALVGDCMKFLGTVKTIKNVRGKHIASLLASQKNISMTGVNPPIEVFSMGERQTEYADLDMVGFTCIEGDVLYRHYDGKLAHNDAVVFENCGSYSLVMKPPFILPNFPVLDISSGTTEVIKQAEKFDDIFHTFSF